MAINWQRLATWFIVLSILFYIVSNPAGAAGLVGTIAATLKQWGLALVSFLTNVLSSLAALF